MSTGVNLLIGFFSFFSLRALVLVGITYLLAIRGVTKKDYRVYRVPYKAGQIKSEFITCIKTLVIDAMFFAVVFYFDLIPFSKFSWVSMITTYTLIFTWYEIWFYWSHRLYHHPKFYFIHRDHHYARVTSPLTALSFSFFERLVTLVGVVMVPMLLGNWIPMCVEGMFLYGTVNLLFNFMGHSNVEFYTENSKRFRKIMTSFFGSTTFHALHHSRMKGHYGLFTSVQDRWFGTVFPDYEQMQERASTAQGFDELHFRFKTSDAELEAAQNQGVELSETKSYLKAH